MATAFITYNSKTINFPETAYSKQIEYPRVRLQNLSASRKHEVLNVSPDAMVTLMFRWLQNSNATDIAVKRNIYQWFEWAARGLPWYIGTDSTKALSTTLSAGAKAGDTTLTLTSVSGLASGDRCIVRSDTDMELVKLSGAPSGLTVTLTEALNFSYASTSRFRNEEYWPARLVDVAKHAIRERPPLHFDVELIFAESWNN